MANHVSHAYPARTELPRWVVTGFISGAVSVLVFHQGMSALLDVLGAYPLAPYSMEPTRPWGVPVLLSLMFWGGVWGVLLAASLGRFEGATLFVASAAFGALLPTLVAFLVVAPLKGQSIAGGGLAMAMAGLLLNGAWGLGTGIGLALFGRSHAGGPRELQER